ncbi:hypothetical protein P7C70_g1480, partial [Phenoliferia sp. Uapishka_3]
MLDAQILRDSIFSSIYTHDISPSSSVTLVTTCTRSECHAYVKSLPESSTQRKDRLLRHPRDVEIQYWFRCKNNSKTTGHGFFNWRADRPDTRPASAVIQHTRQVAPGLTGYQLLAALDSFSPPSPFTRHISQNLKVTRHFGQNPNVIPQATANTSAFRSPSLNSNQRTAYLPASSTTMPTAPTQPCTAADLDRLGTKCDYHKLPHLPGNCNTCRWKLCVDCCDEWHRRQGIARTQCRYHLGTKKRRHKVDPFAAGANLETFPSFTSTALSSSAAAITTAVLDVRTDSNSLHPTGFRSATQAREDRSVGGELVTRGSSALAKHVVGREERIKLQQDAAEERQAVARRAEGVLALKEGHVVQLIVWYKSAHAPKSFPIPLPSSAFGPASGKSTASSRVKPPAVFSFPTGVIQFLLSKGSPHDWSYYAHSSKNWLTLYDLTISTLFPLDRFPSPQLPFCATLLLRIDDLPTYLNLQDEINILGGLLSPPEPPSTSPPSPLSSSNSEEFLPSSYMSDATSGWGRSSPSVVPAKRAAAESSDEDDDDVEILDGATLRTVNDLNSVDVVRLIVADSPAELGSPSFSAYAGRIGWTAAVTQTGMRTRYWKTYDLKLLSRVLRKNHAAMLGLTWGQFRRGSLAASALLRVWQRRESS